MRKEISDVGNRRSEGQREVVKLRKWEDGKNEALIKGLNIFAKTNYLILSCGLLKIVSKK